MKPVGLAAVAHREWGRLRSQRVYWLLGGVAPVLSSALLWAVFAGGVPRDLPVAVLDQDRSALSRQLARMIDATAGVRVAWHVADEEAGRRLLLTGQTYGLVVLPAGLSKAVRRGQQAPVIGYYNAAVLLPGSLVRRDLLASVATLSAGVELRRRRAAGEGRTQALAGFDALRLQRHTLFNPELNYARFLLTALFPTLLQICLLLVVVQAVGSELKEGTAPAWLALAGGRLWRALLGKLLPHVAVFTLWAWLGLAALFGPIGVPPQGSIWVLTLATPLFVAAYVSLGLAFVAWTAHLRLATSLAAFFSGPAFAFVGLTFPVSGMPVAARAWSALLPLTHYVRLLVEQGVRGAPATAAWGSLAALAAFVLVVPALAYRRLARVCADPAFWGRA